MVVEGGFGDELLLINRPIPARFDLRHNVLIDRPRWWLIREPIARLDGGAHIRGNLKTHWAQREQALACGAPRHDERAAHQLEDVLEHISHVDTLTADLACEQEG